MSLSKKERSWLRRGWLKLGITIGIYIMWGDILIAGAESLDGFSHLTASLIVFGVVGMLVTTAIDLVDNKRI